jgi:hypothetical protein
MDPSPLAGYGAAMLFFGLALALAAPPVSPDDPAAIEAEARRLTTEIRSYAADGKSAGVEREYRRLLSLGVRVDPELHVLAADVARDRGDSMTALARLYRVPAGSRAGDRVTEFHDNVLQRYAYLRVSLQPGSEVEVPTFFSPDELKAAQRLATTVAETGVFVGLVPEGVYAFDGARLQLAPRTAYVFPVPPGMAPPEAPRVSVPGVPHGASPIDP